MRNSPTSYPLFKAAYIALKFENPKRVRAVGGGRPGRLPTYEAKLFFVLFYAKNYPTFDVLGFLFEKPRGRSCMDIHLLLTVLEKALGRAIVLPERKLTSVEEFFGKFPEVKDVFLDGGERRIERPTKPKGENRTYSGKKKAHTRKNVVAVDEKKRILVVTPTKAGRRHDKRLADKCSLVTHIPKTVGIFADSGFQGIQHLHPNTVVTTNGAGRMHRSQRKNVPITESSHHCVSW